MRCRPELGDLIPRHLTTDETQRMAGSGAVAGRARSTEAIWAMVRSPACVIWRRRCLWHRFLISNIKTLSFGRRRNDARWNTPQRLCAILARNVLVVGEARLVVTRFIQVRGVLWRMHRRWAAMRVVAVASLAIGGD